MPENAEVAHITDQLNFFFSNRILESVEFLTTTFNKKFKQFDDLVDILPLKLKEVKCKGKMIIFVFFRKPKQQNWDGECKEHKYYYLCCGLGMTGSYGFNIKNEKNTHLHFQFKVENKEYYPDNIKNLYYTDHRRFSNFEFIMGYDDYLKKIKKIQKGFLGEYIISKKQIILNLKKYKENKRRKTDKEICEILTDQKTLCSGIGNYLVSEILYSAKINPWKVTSEITIEEISRIYDSAITIINKSYECNGLSFSDYVDLNDIQGTYKKYLEVYKQTKTKKGEKVLTRIKSGNRTIYYTKEQSI
jgi:DNA-formamidopyrimidine glycosylase